MNYMNDSYWTQVVYPFFCGWMRDMTNSGGAFHVGLSNRHPEETPGKIEISPVHSQCVWISLTLVGIVTNDGIAIINHPPSP